MRALVWLFVGLLIIFQQDYWNWSNDTLYFGFMPHALFYQCIISCATAVVWIIVVQACWPKDLDDDNAADEAVQ